MEPEVIKTLAIEIELYRKKIIKLIPNSATNELGKLFGDMSTLPEEVVLGQWRDEERYDELVDYIIFRYESGGGEEFWKQVLLDFRLKKDEKRAFKMLDGLLPGRIEIYKAKLKNSKKFPNNYLCLAGLAIAKAEVMKVLYEYAYILENKSAEFVDKQKVKKIKEKIEQILSS